MAQEDRVGMTPRKAHAALERLGKWRGVFAGWQLGTRAKGDPESDAVRDHREATLLLRVEGSALAALLIEKGVFTQEEWLGQIGAEAEMLSKGLEQRFPGMKATDRGMQIDARAMETMKGWKP